MSNTTIRVVLGLLIVSFGTWGLHGLTASGTNIVAAADGVEVTKEQVQRILKFTLDNSNEVFRENFNNNPELKAASIKQIINGLLLQKIIVKNLNNLGFYYSNAALAAETKAIGANSNSLEKFMNSYGYTDSEMLADLKDKASLRQLKLSLEAVTPTWPNFRALNQSAIDLEKTIIMTNISEQKVTASEQDLKTYYAAHSDKFLSPRAIKVREIKFIPLTKTGSDSELIRFYNSHIDWYEQPAKFEAKIYRRVASSNLPNFLTAEQSQELKQQNQGLEFVKARVFPENSTDPGVFSILKSLAVNEAEFVMLDGQELMLQLVNKTSANTPSFHDIKAKVAQDFLNAKNQILKEQLRSKLSSYDGKSALANTSVTLHEVNDPTAYEPMISANWFLDPDNVGKTKVIEMNEQPVLLELATLRLPKVMTYESVKDRLKASFLIDQQLSRKLAYAKTLIEHNFKGKQYKITLDSPLLAGVSAAELMQLQFAPEAVAKIFTNGQNVIVARLLSVSSKPGVASELATNVKSSYSRDANKIFLDKLLAK